MIRSRLHHLRPSWFRLLLRFRLRHLRPSC
jgi:hypothetical protein